MQRDRLTDDFSTALKNFQTIQRTAAEKERASVARARAQSGNYTKVHEMLCGVLLHLTKPSNVGIAFDCNKI